MDRRRWTDEQFIEAVKNSISIAQVLEKIGLKATGANYKTVHLYVSKLGCTTEHWLGQAHLKNKKHDWNPKRPFSEILIENSTYTSVNHLKHRLLKDGLLIERCAECPTTNMWNGKPITLQLDHINGEHLDHRLENLRLLCPNCHSQTKTFAGRNKS